MGIAHAVIAEVPAINGLYTNFLPTLTYSLIGSSRHLIVGTGALVALLVGEMFMEATF